MGLSLYVHIPFCVRKCHYCDFNSGPVERGLRARYLQALQQEIRDSQWRGEPACTLFFGGGTPSELNAAELRPLVDALRRTFPPAGPVEWTIECNPGTVDSDSFARLRDLGFNRISLGVQSFHDTFLQILGRIHSAEEARRAFEDVRRSGFNNVNLDLIFALPGQSLDQWDQDLQSAIELQPEHLSLYNLIIEPGTEFGRRHRRGELQETDSDLAADMYERALDRCEAAGYRQYEISNFSRPGLECRHNLTYWRNESYLGFGISAASYLDGTRWTNTGNITRYIEGVASGRVPRNSEERLEAGEALAEEIMLRLRTREGFRLQALGKKYGLDVAGHYAEQLSRLLDSRLIRRSGDRVTLTRRGLLLASEVALCFFEGIRG